jgi:hypothetical protein
LTWQTTWRKTKLQRRFAPITGNFALEQVATLRWNGWKVSSESAGLAFILRILLIPVKMFFGACLPMPGALRRLFGVNLRPRIVELRCAR